MEYNFKRFENCVHACASQVVTQNVTVYETL